VRVEIEQFQNTVTLRCSGRLVQGDGLEQLRRTVMSETAKHLILDLSDVSSIDAGGLGELVELRQWAIDAARTFTVLNPSERVRELVMARLTFSSFSTSRRPLKNPAMPRLLAAARLSVLCRRPFALRICDPLVLR